MQKIVVKNKNLEGKTLHPLEYNNFSFVVTALAAFLRSKRLSRSVCFGEIS